MASVLDPQPASLSTVRWARSGLVVGALVAAVALSACGGDDEKPATTTTPATPTVTGEAATGAPDVRLEVKLDPEQVGTEDRPQPVRIAVDLRMAPTAPDDQGQPVEDVELSIPAGVVFRPDELEACSPETLDREGPKGCPTAARIGSGTVTANAGTLEVAGRATAVYGGDDRVLLWVEITNPVTVGAAIAGRLESQSGGGYRLALQVPADLQEVAGIPVALSRMRVSLGRGDALATTDCPESGLPFAAQLSLGDVTADADAVATCR